LTASAGARPPAMLCNAGYYGTLAAVRSLGRAGIPVVTVDPAVLAPARYSRYTGHHLRCPPFEMTDAWSRWLLALPPGPRAVLYATSDDVSFALANHREELAGSYALYQPDPTAMMSILDKGRLLDHARAVGIGTPETWLPTSRRDVEHMTREVAGPLLVKPRTQVSLRNHTKGVVVPAGSERLLESYDRFIAETSFGDEIASRFPLATQPLVQRYYSQAMDGIYSLSGFRDRSGAHFVVRAANKVLQRPRRLGVGLCFEDAPVDVDLAQRLERLCERLGYFGVFEAEFIRDGDRPLLIDLNARFFNQMIMDVARGMDLPRMAYAGAIGDEAELSALVERARQSVPAESVAFCNGLGLKATIGAQLLFGRISREDARRWYSWSSVAGRKVVDAVADPDDPLPFVCDVAQHVAQYVRHPRAFVLQLGLSG
jgi:D-aspartate ligase